MPLPRFLVVPILCCSGTVFGQSLPGVSQRYDGRYYNIHNPGASWNNESSAYLDGVMAKNAERDRMNNMMISNLIMNNMMVEEIYRREGRKVIAEGRASTRFDAAGESEAIAAKVADIADEAARAREAAALRDSIAGFNKNMKAEGGATSDVADGIALAYVMSYAALREEDPGHARFETLRAKLRAEYLADPRWQGKPSNERRAQYENAAIPAMMAVSARAGSKHPSLSEEQRAGLDRVAKDLATGVLRAYSKQSVDAIELTADGFGDRGERLAASGLGSTTFNRTNPPMLVTDYAERWGFLCKDPGETPAQHYTKSVERFDLVVDAMGGQRNDIADANAAAFAVSYFVATEGAVELSRAQVDSVRALMRVDVLASAQFQRLSDAEKQRGYETLALEAMRERDGFIKNKAIIEATLSEDSWARMSQTIDKNYASSSVLGAVSAARTQLKSIFSPRNLDEWVLVAEGFVQRGRTDFIVAQTASPDAPALAGFSQSAPHQHTPEAAAAPKSAGADAGTILTAAPAATPATKIAPTGQASTLFSRNPARSTIPEMASGLLGLRYSREQLDGMLASFDESVAEFDGSTSDLADGRAMAFTLVYEVYAGDETDLDETQVEQLRRFFRKRVLENTVLQRLDDAGRQGSYEDTAIRAMMLVEEGEKAGAADPNDEVDGVLRDIQRDFNAIAAAEFRAQAKRFLDSLLTPKALDNYEMTPGGLRNR